MGRKVGGSTPELRKICVVGGLVIDPPLQLSLAARRVVAYLVIKGHPVSRPVAAAELWPDVIESAARANLRRALWRLPPGWVNCVGDDLTLHVECDLAEANRASNLALNGEALTLEQIQLLSGDILPGWLDDWILLAHEGFRLLRVQALEAACRTMISKGAFALATQAGAAAFAAEPLRESAAEALIEAHLAQHNRYQAVQCFRELAKRLSLELGVDPDPSLTERLSALSLQL
ncbi:AfsR/SARP family transcriptional regulator [Rhizobium grahamii]|uniref:Transcriptional regulator n=1 Tax=Rhizobium grahamii TaxID=1120045 RepID=A0A370KGH3_9HYPH|nr:BTAD domain-containing putative transcriptional regulator [Rhizobium grahamii]RDJ03875.1 transcriptional regulator [Rhizobium grahamii]